MTPSTRPSQGLQAEKSPAFTTIYQDHLHRLAGLRHRLSGGEDPQQPPIWAVRLNHSLIIRSSYERAGNSINSTLGDAVTTGTTIVMAVYNGALFLQAQLDSLAAQTDRNWQLIAADDGSSDHSWQILQDFAATLPAGQVQLLRGPGEGASQNFRFLLQHPRPAEHALAFCDQDDVWHPDHLSRAHQQIAAAANPLVLYGTRLAYTDQNLRLLGLSPMPKRGPSFRNALIQNIFSGNSMVLSPAAAALLQQADTALRQTQQPVLLHDWWSYQLLAGAGAALIYDPHISLSYRQHGKNLVGAAQGWALWQRRLRQLLAGTRQGWTRQTRQALTPLTAHFTAENQQVFGKFCQALDAPWPRKCGLIRASGIHHQSLPARSAFWLGALAGRL